MRKRGRTAMPKNMKRTERLQILLTQEEMKAARKVAGRDLSSYFRGVVLSFIKGHK
jgi:hypothetical protein